MQKLLGVPLADVQFYLFGIARTHCFWQWLDDMIMIHPTAKQCDLLFVPKCAWCRPTHWIVRICSSRLFSSHLFCYSSRSQITTTRKKTADIRHLTPHCPILCHLHWIWTRGSWKEEEITEGRFPIGWTFRVKTKFWGLNYGVVLLEGVYLVMYYQYQIWYTVLLDWERSYELGWIRSGYLQI